MRMPHNEIDRQAAEWAAKAEGGLADEGDQAELEAWLAADPRHLGAYTKAVAVLSHMDRLRAVGEPPVIHHQPSPPSRRFVLGGGIAASLAVLATVGIYGWRELNEQSFETKLGATEVIPLADGSVVTLNTDSKIRVRYTRTRRDIVLERGEAFFDVAKNKARPFVVTARDIAVRAVGTSFAVQTLPDHPLEVLVREGTVEVKRPAVAVAAPVMVRANMHAIASVDGPIVVSMETANKISQALSWKSGRLSFNDDTLEAAARIFARYSATRIVIDDPAVAKRTITGLFVSNDPIGFAKAVAVSLNLQVEVGGDEVRLRHKSL